MLLEEYRPKSSREFIGNSTALFQIKKWLQNWKKGALYVYGPTGTGKTLALELLAREANFELLRCNADESRGIAGIRQFLSASSQKSLMFKKKAILVDEFDIIESKKGVKELITQSRCPVILIANEYRLSGDLRRYCSLVKFTPPKPSELYAFLEKVCSRENITANRSLLTRLSRSGDIRASLIDLETLSEGYRDKEDDIFAALRILFKSTSMKNVPMRDDLIIWIEENIPEEYTSSEEVAKAYNYLSKADIHNARIMKRQSWSLKKYSMGLSLYGVAMSKKQQNARFVMYKRPRFYPNNAKLLEAVAAKTHTSKRKAREYLKLVKTLSENGTDITDN